MANSGDEYYRLVSDSLLEAAKMWLHGQQFTIGRAGVGVILETACYDAGRFRIEVQGDVFKIVYNDHFTYVDFMVDVEAEVHAFAVEAAREISAFCSGRTEMRMARTLFRRRSMCILTTSTGEQWPFYP